MKLPLCLQIGFLFVAWFLVAFLSPVQAVTVAEQTQNFGNQLNVWSTLQELGDNLSGTLATFTFRVSTAQPNLNQFDFTAENSRIYDKTTNTSLGGCVPAGANPSDSLRGLTFSTANVPSGYQDVTIDFSCRNYNFITGHRYLIQILNANNVPGSGGKRILFAAAAYGVGGEQTTDRFTGGGLRYAFDNKFCDAGSYVWNSSTANNGCNIWTTTKDDLYFVLTNTAPPPPPPKLPVIFIPGIGGSELKASQDIVWSKDDGHGGIFSHAYSANEKIWVNQDEASKLGEDDYFDVLRLKADGLTSEADLSLTGNLTSFGYGEIDSFFTEMGYIKGTNFFTFTYDWRKDVRENKDSLDSLIEQAKTSSGQSKVNMVVHSMGGLIARYYISDSSKASKVNKLIELGVPHLGATLALKSIMYGLWISYKIPLIPLINFGLIPNTEIKDIFANLPSIFELQPSSQYFSFYNNSDKEHPYPFRDDRDIDSNKVTGVLNYDQTKSLLSNLNHNMIVFGLSEQFHNFIDPLLNQSNGTKVYEIVGSNQPTLGQIHETWWITWPVNLIDKTDEIFINGDDTVPLYSASLKSNSLDLSGGAKIYYVEQRHSDLVAKDGVAMQTVKSILNDDNALPVEVKSEKIDLEGEHLSLDDGELELYDDERRHTGIKDDGEIETNIPETFYSTSGKTKHAFVKKKAKQVKVKVTRKKKTASDPQTTNLKIRTYKQDKVSKTKLYKDLPITEKAKVEFALDPTLDTSPSLTLYPDETKSDSIVISSTSEVSGDAALDQTTPTTSIQISGTKDSAGIYTGPVTITLTGSDPDSGILKIEYSLDNGLTVQTYTTPFTISTSGKTTIQFKSIDKVGNEEIPQTVIIEIASPTTSSSSTGSTSSTDSSTATSTVIPTLSEVEGKESSASIQPPSVLGISFENPSHISDQINTGNILGEQKNSNVSQISSPTPKQILSGLLIVSGGIVALASFGLATSFFLKPIPK